MVLEISPFTTFFIHMSVAQVAKTRKGKRILEGREPLIIENEKKLLLIRASTADEISQMVLKEFLALKPHASVKLFKKSNDFNPFEDFSSIEHWSAKFDASLFMYASHSKKRPQNLVFGRLFNYEMLEFLELGLIGYDPAEFFEVQRRYTASVRPFLVFHGDHWSNDERYVRLQSIFMDIFHFAQDTQMNLLDMQHVIYFVAGPNGTVCMRHYQVRMRKSGRKEPRIELENVGANIDMEFRRVSYADPEILKMALKKPRTRPGKTKNVSTNDMGETVGQLRFKKQNLRQIPRYKNKALRKRTIVEDGQKVQKITE
ncbi:hypothetical protein PCE1_004199 [Barthelona sp. PCE]